MIFPTLNEEYNVRVPRIMKHYVFEKVLGSGSFAVVVAAHDIKNPSKRVAIKVLTRESVMKQGILQNLEAELRIVERLDHPNIIKIYEVLYEEDIIMIVSEYCKNGDMQDYIQNKASMNITETLRIAYEILSALDYLHKRGISHRDIKPENIVFDSLMHPKLVDFGFCKQSTDPMTTLCGTPFFMPPEMIVSNQYDGPKGDIWSFGITLYLFVFGEFPWGPLSIGQYMRALRDGSLNLNMRTNGKINDIISNSLIFDPMRRASAEKLLGFFNQTANKSVFYNLGSNKFARTNISLRPRSILKKESASAKDYQQPRPLIIRPNELPTTASFKKRIIFNCK